MPDYKAPLRDIRFVRDELLGYEAHYQSLPACQDATPDMVDAILEEGAKFCEQVLAPLNRVGDIEGCTRAKPGLKPLQASKKPTNNSLKAAGRAWRMTLTTVVRGCRNLWVWPSAKWLAKPTGPGACTRACRTAP